MVFFISLESSWNVDVLNGLALFIWTFETQVMAKRRVGSQTASLTPDHKKVGNQPNLLSCRGRVTYRWKALNESYNFELDRIAIRGLLEKLWGPKVAKVPFGKNSHLDVASVESCRVYYKGEGGGFPQVRAVVSLVCPCCPWLVLAPRVFQLCTNHFAWVVCRPV
jgi:hypothetical protein